MALLLRIVKRFWTHSALLGLWVFTSFCWVLVHQGFKQAVFAVIAQFIALYVYLICLWLCHTRRVLRPFRYVVYALGSVFIMSQALSIIFIIVQGIPLDPSYVLDSENDVLDTVTDELGLPVILQSEAAIVFCFTIISVLLAKVIYNVRDRHHSYYFPLFLLMVWFPHTWWQPAQHLMPFMYFSSRDVQVADLAEAHNLPGSPSAVTLDYGKFHSADGAPVFILQLESGNALAYFGAATPDKGPADLIPQMYGARTQGVLFSHIWGPTIRTHRAQGAILCSSVLDIFKGISFYPDVPKKTCLPALLDADGYKTFFGSAYWKPNYAWTSDFMTDIGYSERHFSDFMNEDTDRYWDWGYDDCKFYDRYFDYLEQHFKPDQLQSRFLGHIAVSANHYGFANKQYYEDIAPYHNPNTFVKKYLNSSAAQDYCLGRFFKRIEPYREHSHIFIMADHSWPVGIDGGSSDAAEGAAPENFLIPLLYLPPRDKEKEFRTDVVLPNTVGEDEVLPTILELLSGSPYANSFASLLKQTPDGSEPVLPENYDDCHVMTQPYDGTQVAVVRDNIKVTYNFTHHSVVFSVLSGKFLHETILDQPPVDMTYTQFLEQYLCKRFRYWEPRTTWPRAKPSIKNE